MWACDATTGVSGVGSRRAPRAWRLYLLLGVLSASGYFFIPSPDTRNLVYDVVNNVVGISTVAIVLIGVRMYRPARALPWHLFALGLALFAIGDLTVTAYEVVMRARVPSPAPTDVFYLVFYPVMIVGLLMLQSPRLGRRGLADLIDPLIIATGAGLLFWVCLMRPYLIEPLGEHPEIAPLPIVIAVAYPLMDLLLLVVLVRTLFVSRKRSPAYLLLGAGLGTLLLADVVWTLAQALNSYWLGHPIDAAFLLFFVPFGAAALHPSMADLFEPVPRVEATLTRPRLMLLAGASLMAPGALALQAILGQPVAVPLIVASSALLFLLVIARMSGMMRTQERAAERERILRQAGAVLAAASDSKTLYKNSVAAVLDLLRNVPGTRVSLWLGSDEEMEVVTAGEHREKVLDTPMALDDLPADVRLWLLEGLSVRAHPADVALLQNVSRQGSTAREFFVVPLRTREELTGAMMVTCNVPLQQESKNALEALGAEIALASENLQLLEEARLMSVIEERQRLAHEIHDTLAQGFTSIAMNISAAQLAEPQTFSDSAPARRHLELARHIARESLAEARRLVWALRPESLDRHTLPEALKNLTEEWSKETSIEARINTTGTPRRLLPEAEAALVRIAQEALSNIRKHANASRTMLTLSYMDDLIVLDVSDDGTGFDLAAPKRKINPRDEGGFGLVAIRERIEQFGGQLLVESTLGRGTTLAVELPVARELTDPLGEYERIERRASKESG